MIGFFIPPNLNSTTTKVTTIYCRRFCAQIIMLWFVAWIDECMRPIPGKGIHNSIKLAKNHMFVCLGIKQSIFPDSLWTSWSKVKVSFEAFHKLRWNNFENFWPLFVEKLKHDTLICKFLSEPNFQVFSYKNRTLVF